MLYILHGDDTDAAYKRLTAIQSLHKDSEKIYINASDEESLYLNFFSEGLFQSKKLLICENLLTSKKKTKIKPELFKNINSQTDVIIWEKQEASTSTLNKFKNIAQIEKFKLPTNLFIFLDSISKDAKRPIFYLKELEREKVASVSWHLENRLLLLILSKLNFSQSEAALISGRNLASWQWEKLKQQSTNLNINILKKMFNATLKIETLIKSGKTQIAENILLSLMLLKYLGRQNS